MSPTVTRTAAVAVAAALVAFGPALPAGAHATLDRDRVPPDTEVGLTLRAPVEGRDHGAPSDLRERHNRRLTVQIPSGFRALACDPKPGWVCSVNEARGRTPHHIAWNRQGGPIEEVDRVTFRVHSASQPGRYPFNTHQTYSDGDVVHWDGPPGSSHPAPAVEVR